MSWTGEKVDAWHPGAWLPREAASEFRSSVQSSDDAVSELSAELCFEHHLFRFVYEQPVFGKHSRNSVSVRGFFRFEAASFETARVCGFFFGFFQGEQKQEDVKRGKHRATEWNRQHRLPTVPLCRRRPKRRKTSNALRGKC